MINSRVASKLAEDEIRSCNGQFFLHQPAWSFKTKPSFTSFCIIFNSSAKFQRLLGQDFRSIQQFWVFCLDFVKYKLLCDIENLHGLVKTSELVQHTHWFVSCNMYINKEVGTYVTATASLWEKPSGKKAALTFCKTAKMD